MAWRLKITKFTANRKNIKIEYNRQQDNAIQTYSRLRCSPHDVWNCLSSQVRVLYGGNDVFDYEVSSAFWHDVSLAIISVVTIVVLMLVLTSFSIWLTLCGVVTIVLSFPLAYFFYRVVFRDVALGMLNGAAAFVVVGIGNVHVC